MGCHTWSFKKVSALTETEKQRFAEDAITEAKTWWGFDYTIDELIEEVKSWYIEQPDLFTKERCGDPKKYALNLLKKYTEKRDQAIKGGFDYWLKENKNHYPVCFNHNGEQYVNIDFDRPFRCHDFLEGFVTSKDELLNILKNQQPAMIGYYNLENHNFISGYTDELVKRIDDYYALHGEDNIMFDFG